MNTPSQVILPILPMNYHHKFKKPPMIPHYHYNHNPHIQINNDQCFNQSINHHPIYHKNRSQSASNKTNNDYNIQIPNNQLYLSNEFLSKSIIQQHNNERRYADTILQKTQERQIKERDIIRHDFIKQQQQCDYLENQRYKEKNNSIAFNKEMLQMQIKQNELKAIEQKRLRAYSMNEFQDRVNKENMIYEIERAKNQQIKKYYRIALEGQIVLQLVNKIEKDDMSNRSRIKNRLLLNDYISTINRDNC